MRAPKKKSNAFQEYAKLYDVFYEGKEYNKESEYVLRLLAKHLGRKPKLILDLGCGTGGHALKWAAKGIAVTGLDRSAVMLEQAKQKAGTKNVNIAFLQGDVRKFSLKKKFDAVTAMFAVMSYQTNRDDMVSAFRSIRAHCTTGGIFLFDAWFGPGVLTDPPGERVKSFRKGAREILRTVKSVHHVEHQLVEVHYDILVIEGNEILHRVKEIHPMHYFFPREVEDLAASTGFKLLDTHPFLRTKDSLTVSDWNATFVLRAG